MNPDPKSAQEALLNARQAISLGDRQAARHWAELAASLSPELEEPWLILAAVAAPRASVAYLEKALKINPSSQRARKGMHWAVARLRKETAAKAAAAGLPETQPNKTTEEGLTRPHRVTPEGVTRPTQVTRPVRTVSSSAPAAGSPPDKTISGHRWSLLGVVTLVVIVSAAWLLWPGNASAIPAFLQAPLSTRQAHGAPADLGKPTYTPTFTPTFTPTETFTPTPTFTPSPIPTDTPLPTATPRPTDPPPAPTDVPPYTYPDNGGTRWIDVDLSQQMLYAYEGDTVVASFLVSTGVPAFPTVTGQYHIYIKLESTLMAGPGYYLPNVPYTMYFYKGYGIHGTYWHNNFGHPMSHGCVNMYTPDAEWMFYWASVGTLVNVHY